MEATSAGDARTRVLTRHTATVGAPHVIVNAPGRVNLIGEHTDYNDGYVAPVALAMGTTVAASRITGDHLRVTAAGFGDTVINLADPMRDVPEWAHHIAGCAAACARHGIDVAASALTVDTDLPVGAGVSSSAALEIAVLSALASLAGHEIDPITIALLAQKVENDWVGVPSGIMDPMVIAGARHQVEMVTPAAGGPHHTRAR
jgi:galactokinase